MLSLVAVEGGNGCEDGLAWITSAAWMWADGDADALAS